MKKVYFYITLYTWFFYKNDKFIYITDKIISNSQLKYILNFEFLDKNYII